MRSTKTSESPGTLIVHCGKKVVVPNGEKSVDAIPAVHLSSSYLFKSADDILEVTRGEPGYVYRRLGNENCVDLSMAVAQIEHATDAVCFSSGMAAISASFIAAGMFTSKGSVSGVKKKVLGPYSCYGSTYTLLKSRFNEIALCEFQDMSDTEAAIAHIKSMKPDVLYMETSSNPVTVVTDFPKLVAALKSVNPNALSIIDNTYATGLLVKPIDFGVDVVLHSMTKYINGHGDVLAGIVVSNNKEYMHKVQHAVVDFGGCLSPWDAWLCLRGLRTLAVRMDCIGKNALVIAKFLTAHPLISRVLYPGLPSHPQYNVVKDIIAIHLDEKEVLEGFAFSGMIAFDIIANNNNFDAAKLFLDSITLISSQVSLGDVKTLACCPALATQQQVSLEDQLLTGIRSTTIRLSVGMESVEDICADLDQALHKAGHATHNVNDVMAVEAAVSDVTLDRGRDSTMSEKVPHTSCTAASTLSARRVRLAELYGEMNAITAEIESIQSLIKEDNIQLMSSDYQV